LGVSLSHLAVPQHKAPASAAKRAARRPLILVFIAAAMPLALFAGWVVFLNAQQQRRDSQAAAVETLDSVVSRLASEISLQLEIAETIAASATLDKPDLDAFYREATRINEGRPLWQTIQLVDPEGNQVLDVTRPLGDRIGPTADRENFEQILRTRRPAIGGIGPRGSVTGKRIVAVRAPVERDGQLKFVLTVALVPDAISQIFNSAGTPAGWVGFVVDAKGNIVARTPGERSELGQSASDTVRQAIAAAPQGSYVKTTPDGDQVDSIYKVIPGTSGWSVHLGIPTQELNGPVQRSAIFLAGGGVLSLALALTLAWFTIRDISLRRREQEAQAALALSASEERRRLTVDAAVLGVFSWDFATREALISPRAREMLHIEGFLSHGDTSLPIDRMLSSIDPADQEHFEASLLGCRSGNIAIADFRTARPHRRWLRASGRLSRLDEKNPDVVYGVIQDIDATKRAELERQQLLRRLSEAQENERRRIARELHDQIGQTVTGLLLGLKNLEQFLGARHKREVGLEKLHWLQGLARGIGRDIHQVASDLRPTALDDLGLYKALEAVCAEVRRRFGISVDFQSLGGRQRLGPDVEIAVYRAVQEAVNNVVKHAQARNVSVVVDRRATELRIVVEDDGNGFDLQEFSQSDTRHSKLGLSVIEERLTLLGGSLAIESEPGHGTSLFMRIPVTIEEMGNVPDPDHVN
jgi:signal transduction histidine kinase